MHNDQTLSNVFSGYKITYQNYMVCNVAGNCYLKRQYGSVTLLFLKQARFYGLYVSDIVYNLLMTSCI